MSPVIKIKYFKYFTFLVFFKDLQYSKKIFPFCSFLYFNRYFQDRTIVQINLQIQRVLNVFSKGQLITQQWGCFCDSVAETLWWKIILIYLSWKNCSDYRRIDPCSIVSILQYNISWVRYIVLHSHRSKMTSLLVAYWLTFCCSLPSYWRLRSLSPDWLHAVRGRSSIEVEQLTLLQQLMGPK